MNDKSRPWLLTPHPGSLKALPGLRATKETPGLMGPVHPGHAAPNLIGSLSPTLQPICGEFIGPATTASYGSQALLMIIQSWNWS